MTSFAKLFIILYFFSSILCAASNIEIRNHPDTQLWWMAFYMSGEDVSCGGTITSVEIKDNVHYTNWYPNAVTYNQWGYYGFNHNGHPFNFPFSIRITKTSGAPEIIIANNIITSFTGNAVFDFGSNFCTTPTTPAPTTATNSPTTAAPTQPTVYPIDLTEGYALATIAGCGTDYKYISLTFDDGPEEQNDATLDIINALNNYGIVATFYVSPAGSGEDGLNQRCDLIQELVDAGNEVQSHSYSHTNFKSLTNQQIKDELNAVKNFIMDCGGAAPTIFRPPYGALTKAQARYIVQDPELGYVLGLWNLDTNDWQGPNNFATISGNINLNVYEADDMSITMLMHDRSVHEIINEIINLFNEGYEFITQTECYQRCDTKDSLGVCVSGAHDWYQINEWR